MWMDLESVIRMKTKTVKQILYINTYAGHLEKNGKDDLICKAEIETQT